MLSITPYTRNPIGFASYRISEVDASIRDNAGTTREVVVKLVFCSKRYVPNFLVFHACGCYRILDRIEVFVKYVSF